MLNWILALIAIVLWAGAYGWYYHQDIAGLWAQRRARRAMMKEPRG